MEIDAIPKVINLVAQHACSTPSFILAAINTGLFASMMALTMDGWRVR